MATAGAVQSAGEGDAHAREGGHGVTPLELFFDLVFVLAITQVTAMMADDPTWKGLARGLLVLAALWWGWAAYAWLTNAIDPDEGWTRIAMLAAMTGVLIVALAVPGAFNENAFEFGVAYAFVRLMHLALYAFGTRNTDVLGAVLRMTPTSVLAPGLIIAASFFDGVTQGLFWVAALVVDYGGVLIGRGRGWTLHPSHFAERHGLIVIIALGESIVALGIGRHRRSSSMARRSSRRCSRRSLRRRSGGPTSTSRRSSPSAA